MSRTCRTTLVLTLALASVVVVPPDLTRAEAPKRPADPPAGQAIYEEHCARCHGPTGRGDGPEGVRLIVPPANLQSARSRARNDVELITIVEYGVAFSPMHAWRGRLTDEQLLDVVDYVRTLAPFEPAR